MDLTDLKRELANMLATLPQFDPATGGYYSPMRYCKAYAQAPMSLSEIELPTWVIFTGGATYPNPGDQSDNRLAYETRDLFLRLYINYIQQGIDGEAERVAQPYIEPARNLIQSHMLLYTEEGAEEPDIVAGIMRTYLIRDDGVTNFPFNTPGQNYTGLRFTIRVEGRNTVVYGNQ